MRPSVTTPDPGWLIAIATLFAAVSGYYLSKRGQRDTATQQGAATKLAERVQAFDEMKTLVDELNGQLRDARAALREAAVENDRRSDEQGRRCRVAIDHALDTIAVLQHVVRDEIEKEAAEVVKAEARRHTNTDHSASRGRDSDQPSD